MPAFIDDGYEFDGYIAAVPDAHEAINFEYRPAGADSINRHSWSFANADEYNEKVNNLLAEHVLAWDICGKNKQPVEITPANCGRLLDSVRRRLKDIVSGDGKSDPPPDKTPAKADPVAEFVKTPEDTPEAALKN